MGVTVADDLVASASDAIEVWPENRDSALLFDRLGTQWRALLGAAGLVRLGLDYAAAEAAVRRQGWKRRKMDRVFDDLTVMEGEALAMFASLEG